MHLPNHAFELAARDFYQPKLLDILMARGRALRAIAPQRRRSRSPRTCMGTLRFGSDPRRACATPSGRFHDVGNLYAADGALFPTSSGFNPTMTIVALASRVAAGIAWPGMPEKLLTA